MGDERKKQAHSKISHDIGDDVRSVESVSSRPSLAVHIVSNSNFPCSFLASML